MNDADLTNSTMPTKWVVGVMIWMFSTFGSAMIVVFWVGGYKSETDTAIETLRAQQAAQALIVARIPDRLTRMEMIICATEDKTRAQQCNRLAIE